MKKTLSLIISAMLIIVSIGAAFLNVQADEQFFTYVVLKCLEETEEGDMHCIVFEIRDTYKENVYYVSGATLPKNNCAAGAKFKVYGASVASFDSTSGYLNYDKAEYAGQVSDEELKTCINKYEQALDDLYESYAEDKNIDEMSQPKNAIQHLYESAESNKEFFLYYDKYMNTSGEVTVEQPVEAYYAAES